MKKRTRKVGEKKSLPLPAPTADTEWEFRMVIRYVDVIRVQSLEQDGKTDIVNERIIDQSQRGNIGKLEHNR